MVLPRSNAAQAKVGAVVATYNKATRAASQTEERLGVLKEQAGKAATAINKVAGKVSPSLANIVPTGALGVDATPAAEAVKPFPHLLIMQPLKPGSTPFYFNLDTAAFDELKRSSEYRWASQERLNRRPAQHCRPASTAGLTTGYGEVLGNWCLKNIEEEQSALLQGGIPRKQGFTLEFVRYGDDLQNS